MNDEFNRFLVLFDQLALFNEAWLDKMPPERLDWVPIENASMKFGDRVSRITVKGLMIHVCAGEDHWVEQLGSVADGAVIAIPKNKELEERLSTGDWRALTVGMHRQRMERMRGFGAAELGKKVVFADRHYTGMGLLWAMYAHRAFHLGNIDIYLRQTDTVAPDFFRFPSEQMA
jgi:uncharacterized damage-inducible protein DinB